MMVLDQYKITNDSLTSLTGGGQPIGASPFSFPGIILQETYTEAGAVDEFGSQYSPLRREYYTDKMANDEILSSLSKVIMT